MMAINIYTPYEPHCDGEIWGDRASLIKLQEALSRVLSHGFNNEAVASFEDFDSNGEGLTVRVVLHPMEGVEAPYGSSAVSNYFQ